MINNKVQKLDLQGRDLLEKINSSEDVLSLRFGGYNANSGAIGSFIFALPAATPVALVAAGAASVIASTSLLKFFKDKLNLDKDNEEN